MKLLIADDEYFIRKSLLQMLDYPSLGFQLAGEAENGKQALEIILKEQPETAILDIKMPLLSGLDIAKEIHRKNLPTKVIILTSYDYFSYAQESIRLGVFSYLLKPVDRQNLKDVLIQARTCIEKEREERDILAKYRRIKLEELLYDYLSAAKTASLPAEPLQNFLTAKGLSNPLPALFKFENPDGMSGLMERLRDFWDEQATPKTFFFFEYGENIFGLLCCIPSESSPH